MTETLSQRHEFLFLYDIRMGNPNGDPAENRPRRLPDGTFYVSDVRLKRFVRDWLKTQKELILVDRPEDAATNLTGRLQMFLRDKPEIVRPQCEEYEQLLAKEAEKARKAKEKKANEKKEKAKKAKEEKQGTLPPSLTPEEEDKPSEEEEQADPTSPQAQAGRLVVDIIRKAFVDARLFGSSFAFKDWKVGDKNIAPRPKTLTGAVQINMGEVLHPAYEVNHAGSSIFTSDESKTQGTFTATHLLRYGLIGFNGVANEHSASLSQLTNADYERLLYALWKGVASAPTANTRSKAGQIPRLLVDVTYRPKTEFQFGRLLNYVKVIPRDGLLPAQMASPEDYQLDLSLLAQRLRHVHVEKVHYAIHPDLNCVGIPPDALLSVQPAEKLPSDLSTQLATPSWIRMDLDVLSALFDKR